MTKILLEQDDETIIIFLYSVTLIKNNLSKFQKFIYKTRFDKKNARNGFCDTNKDLHATRNA